MRMWMCPTNILCQKHLMGEHGEIHKHRHNFVKRHSVVGRIIPVVQIEPESMQSRHDALALEMTNRGYNHKSPYEMPDISYLHQDLRKAKVDVDSSTEDLINRCPDCKKRYYEVTSMEEN